MNLKEFLLTKMRMTGPYQPVIIKCLLENNGEVDLETIAKFLASKDKDSIAYYAKKLKIYPKQVLKKHNIALENKGIYKLSDVLNIDKSSKDELIHLCDLKIDEYYSKYIIEDESKSGWGLLRAHMIAEHPYCQMCGLWPGDDITLDVDHMIQETYRYCAINVIEAKITI